MQEKVKISKTLSLIMLTKKNLISLFITRMKNKKTVTKKMRKKKVIEISKILTNKKNVSRKNRTKKITSDVKIREKMMPANRKTEWTRIRAWKKSIRSVWMKLKARKNDNKSKIDIIRKKNAKIRTEKLKMKDVLKIEIRKMSSKNKIIIKNKNVTRKILTSSKSRTLKIISLTKSGVKKI